MSGALHSLLAFIVTLGILIVVHEFGHYWVARRAGVKILKFSVGFGRPLWARKFGPDQTEFILATIPLGGYVKMLDEREDPVPPDELHREFNRQPLAARAAIVAAGPVFNLVFAILAYWLMYLAGVTGPRPLIGDVAPGSIAEKAGIKANDEIINVEARPTPTWEAVINASIGKLLKGEAMAITVQGENKQQRQLQLELRSVSVDDLSKNNLLQILGLRGYRPHLDAVIGELLPGGAAERAGLKPWDRVLAADGQNLADWEQWANYVKARPGQLIKVEVQRGERRLVMELRPERHETADGKIAGRIGAVAHWPEALTRQLSGEERYPPLDALAHAFGKTWDMSITTLRMMVKMLFGEASVQNLSGPLSIAQYAGQSASMGVTAFLSFLAIVSISLGVLNLLPIPVLDGGHLMYYLIELIRRKPLSEMAQRMAQQAGMIVLLGLMGLAFYNDIMRIFN
jgi:regulator of sigma E protease